MHKSFIRFLSRDGFTSLELAKPVIIGKALVKTSAANVATAGEI
jgi:hypothetical protein